MALSFSLPASLMSMARVSAGILLKASSVGANTVKGPAPSRVLSRPACESAAVSWPRWTMVERARSAEVPVLLPPTAQPWGERIAYLEDPDGNLVMLAQ